MINELYALSNALESSNIHPKWWHMKYLPIPKITAKAPCVRITVSNGSVLEVSEVEAELGKCLRKYGSNQGSYPCMNLAPLYRITDEAVKKQLSDLAQYPEKIDDRRKEQLKALCTENNNNWCNTFLGKYECSMINLPTELSGIAAEGSPAAVLISETAPFADAKLLHAELKKAAWEMLDNGEKSALALNILFHRGSKNKEAEKDYGNLSVAFDCKKLIDAGVPAVSAHFVDSLNEPLLRYDEREHNEGEKTAIDAFGVPFVPFSEPMPAVRLGCGFSVVIRTMFKGQPCQTRYGKIEDKGYPVSWEMRMRFKSALEWISAAEQENKTWIKTAPKNEAMFVYPQSLPEIPVSFTAMFGQSSDSSLDFSTAAEKFIRQLRSTRAVGADSYSNRIRIFALKAIDKARTRVVYTRETDPNELEKCSEAWTAGCANLPDFAFGKPRTLFPLEASDILNRQWKQNGEIMKADFEPYAKYHGIDLLLEPGLSVRREMHQLAESAVQIGAFYGTLCAKKFKPDKAKGKPDIEKVREMLTLMGLLLYRENIRKDDKMDKDYTKSYPYLYGQLLKAADELHILYCRVVRKNDIPAQLVGGSLFRSAAEAPSRTMPVLAQRLAIYYTWASSYREKLDEKHKNEISRAGMLHSICENIMVSLQGCDIGQERFSDEEKTLLFIGYLATLPNDKETKNEEDKTNG